MRESFNYLWIIAMLVVLSACASDDVYLDRDLELPENERIEVTDGLSVTVSEISDSRCPLDAYCIGISFAKVALTLDIDEFPYEVTLDNLTNREVTVGEYQVTYLDVLPYPEVLVPNQNEPKVLKFRINKRD